MTTEKNNKKNRVLGIVFLVLFVVINVARFAVRMNHQSYTPPPVTAEDMFRLASQPVTEAERQDEFERKFGGNGSLARMREIQRALSAGQSATQPETGSR